jgi:hypothetical protein
MIKDSAILASLPGLIALNHDPCNNCQNGHKCLEASWVPSILIKKWKISWREEAERIPSLGEAPEPLAQVKYLKTIRSAKLESFIKKNCIDQNGHCP